MEMSGNPWERAVSLGNVVGRSYKGVHGDGNLFRDGNANVDFWPGINGNNVVNIANTAFNGNTGITVAAGSCLRGGGWFSDISFLRVSDRASATNTASTRNFNFGFRGVRVCP
jgi:hypothetical protein